jgi:hypothetical protein
MPNRLDKAVRITQIAAVAYRAAVPARCVTTKAPKSVGGGLSSGSSGGSGGGSFNYPVSHYDGSGNYLPSGDYQSYTRPPIKGGGSTTVCYPAVIGIAGSPARLVIDLSPGWSGGAQSLAPLAGDFLFSLLSTPVPVGVVVGIAAPYAAPGLNTIEHGFKLNGARITIIENGIEVAVCSLLPSDGSRLFIARYNGRIIYTAGDWSYVSASPSWGDKSATALLYSHGDYVTDPVIAAAANPELSARGKVGFSIGVAQSLTARARAGFRSRARSNKARIGFRSSASMTAGWDLSARTLIGPAAAARLSTNGVTLFLPALAVIASDTRRGRVSFTLPSLSVDAASGYALPDIGVGAIGIPAPIITGLVKVGEVGQASIGLAGLTIRGSDHPTGDGLIMLPRLSVNGSSLEYDPDGAFMYEVCQLFHVVLADTIVYARWREEVGVGAQLLISAIVTDAMYESIIARDSISPTQVMFEVMRDAMEISTSSGAVDDVVMQYATNMLTGAATRYEGFGFEGFATSGLDCYAYNAAGVYVIEDGTGDDGESISAAIDFAMAGTDSSFNKRIENLYFGLASDGNVYARVKTEHGNEITYQAIASQSAYRATCAKGAQSRHWALKLEVIDATYANLDSVEWDIKAMTRRANQ